MFLFIHKYHKVMLSLNKLFNLYSWECKYIYIYKHSRLPKITIYIEIELIDITIKTEVLRSLWLTV